MCSQVAHFHIENYLNKSISFHNSLTNYCVWCENYNEIMKIKSIDGLDLKYGANITINICNTQINSTKAEANFDLIDQNEDNVCHISFGYHGKQSGNEVSVVCPKVDYYLETGVTYVNENPVNEVHLTIFEKDVGNKLYENFRDYILQKENNYIFKKPVN
jgi:hypothetical protein